MPFVLKSVHIREPQKAFLFCIKELGYTQKEAQSLIARGRLFVNSKVVTNSAQEISGNIEYISFEPISKGLKPVYETDDFVLFDKPSSMLVHPQNRYTPYSLIDELKFQFGTQANIAHRIDMETSGLVLCSKHKDSEKSLKMLFERREIKKRYLALVFGKLSREFTCIAPLKVFKDKSSPIVRSLVKVDESGKNSITHFKPVAYFDNLDMTLVQCYPHTGRQHQIRAHLFHVKHSIVGDPLYTINESLTRKYLDRELDIDNRIKMIGSARMLLHADMLSFKYKDINYEIQSELDFVRVCKENVNNLS